MKNITLILFVLALFVSGSFQKQIMKNEILKEKVVHEKFDSLRIILTDSRTTNSSSIKSTVFMDTTITSSNTVFPLIDSVLSLDKNHRSPTYELCPHILDIKIQYFNKNNNEIEVARFNSCRLEGSSFEIVKLLAEKIFNYPHDFISPPKENKRRKKGSCFRKYRRYKSSQLRCSCTATFLFTYKHLFYG